MTLWIVVPAFNEAESLPQVLPDIATSAAAIDPGARVLVVDDGSTDGTPQVVEQIRESHPEVLLVSMTGNKGKAAALKRGLGLAVESGATTVAMMDADGQDDPAELSRLIAHLNPPAVSLVTGARTVRNDRFIKRNTSKIYNWATSALSGVPGRDFNSGFKVMTGPVARDVAPMMYGELHRYLTVMAHWLGYRVAEVTVEHHPRVAGRSKYGIARFWRGFVDLLTIRFLMSYEHRPSHLFSGFGFLGLLSGGLVLTYLMIVRIVLDQPIGGRPLLLAGVILFLGGLQLVLFGLLAELVVHARNRAPAVTLAGERVTGD